MQPRKRMKMCASCDGMVDLDVIVCPYCGADFAKNNQESEAAHNTPPLEETLSALYPPPYKPKSFGAEREAQSSFSNSDPLHQADPMNPMMGLPEDVNSESGQVNRVKTETAAASFPEVQEEEEGRQKKTILATLLFSLGVNLLLFSLFLLFFSTNGELFLRWDAGLWYLYSLLGAGMLAGGYKLLGKLTSPSS